MSGDSQAFDFEAFFREEAKSTEDVIKRCDDMLQNGGGTRFPSRLGEGGIGGRPLMVEEVDGMSAYWRREDLELLLQGGDDAFARPREAKFDAALGQALMVAIEKQNLSAVKFLLGQGVAPCWAYANAALKNRDTTILQLLLDYGWDINEQRAWCEPPLLGQAVEDYDMMIWFLHHGADPNKRCYLDITPLSQAVREAPFETIKLLFRRGGSVHSGQLIHHAIGRIHHHPDTIEVLDYLLEKGSPINKIQYEGDYQSLPQSLFTIGTPLHGAVHCGSLDIVKFLLSKGAHPLIRDTLRLTPVQRAEMQGKTEIMDYLRPISETAEPVEPQFTDWYHAPGYESLAGKFWREIRP